MKKSTRKIKANETLEIIKTGFYFDTDGNKIILKNEIDFAINNSKFHSSESLDIIKDTIDLNNNYQTSFSVTNEDSISAILRLKKEEKKDIMCLNFASAKNPGGGFLNEALAQEESLAVSSALYGCQMNAFDFYTTHRNMKSCTYTDGMIHSPNVPVFRDRNGNLISNNIACSFITAAAVNKGVIKLKESHLLDKVTEIMDVRIEKMLSLCVKEQHKNLILGAWGCGVFQNDPNIIANLFYKHLQEKFKNQFETVVFAIYSRNEKFIEAFKTVFEK